ncbi:MAG: SU10 major capsid protein [Candidatus Puniceispirillales bacterium]
MAYATLRNMKTEDRAQTGDAIKKEIICEGTLVCRNEKAHGIVADLSTS